MRHFVTCVVVFLIGLAVGQTSSSPKDVVLDDYRVINISPAGVVEGTDAADLQVYQATIMSPDRRMVTIPIMTDVAEIYARGLSRSGPTR